MSNREEAGKRGSLKESGEEPSKLSGSTTTDRHRLFSSLFFAGRPNQIEDNSRKSAPRELSQAAPTSHSVVADSGEEPSPSNQNQIDGILLQIEQQLPHDPIALRQTTVYKGALEILKWQRDNYLVGTEYADWRKIDRQRPHNQSFSIGPPLSVENHEIPYDDEALGHRQLAQVAGEFIPTHLVQSLATPVVVGLFDPKGALFESVKNASVGVIVGQQSNLEQTIKGQLLQFLDDPQNRLAMKNSTQGMLIQRANTDKSGTGQQ